MSSVSEANLNGPVAVNGYIALPRHSVTVRTDNGCCMCRCNYFVTKTKLSFSNDDALMILDTLPEGVIEFPAVTVGIRWEQYQSCNQPVDAASEAGASEIGSSLLVESQGVQVPSPSRSYQLCVGHKTHDVARNWRPRRVARSSARLSASCSSAARRRTGGASWASTRSGPNIRIVVLFGLAASSARVRQGAKTRVCRGLQLQPPG